MISRKDIEQALNTYRNNLTLPQDYDKLAPVACAAGALLAALKLSDSGYCDEAMASYNWAVEILKENGIATNT